MSAKLINFNRPGLCHQLINHRSHIILFFRSSSVGCTPKESISAPPVEGLYDARSSDFTNSPFGREQVRKGSQ